MTGTEAHRLLAVSALVGECESLVSSGQLTEPAELSLRYLIAQTLAAHGMPPRSEFPRTAGAAA